MEPSVTDMFNDPRLLAPPRTVRVGFDDGSFVLRSPEPLKPYARCVGEWLERWAAETPDAPAFRERRPDGGWRALSWGETRTQVGRIAQSLLGLKLAPQAPIVVLYGHDQPRPFWDSEDWVHASDHGRFHDAGVPFLYLGVPDHADYHRPGDTFAAIDADFFVDCAAFALSLVAAADAAE